jgi:hypothetical protein
MTVYKKKILSYNEILESIQNNSIPIEYLERDWYAIYRSGLTIAHILSFLNNEKDFGIIYPKHDKILHPKREFNNCLLIEDSLYTGGTYKKCIELINKYESYEDIKLLSLFTDNFWVIKPDFYFINANEDNKNIWFYVPWEINDGLVSTPEGHGFEEV